MVIVDYEIGLPDHAVAEWELYSQGLLYVPAVLLDDARPWGRQRRPGIVDISEDRYDTMPLRIAERLLDLDAVGVLAERVDRLLGTAAEQVAAVDRKILAGRPASVTSVVDAVCRVMALHVVNWMWPTERFEDIASTVLGDQVLGHRAVLTLTVPSQPAHMLDFHQHVLTAVERTATDPGQARAVAAALASEVGFLQRPAMPGLAAQPWEHADTTAGVLAGWAASTEATGCVEQGAALRAAHQRAQADRRAILAALLAAASGDPQRWHQVQAIAVACRIAADAEERRKVTQLRFLRLVRTMADRLELPPATSTLAELACAGTVPMSTKAARC